MTLVELLIAASLMIVVLGATLAAVERFQRGSNANQAQNDSQEAARSAVDRMVRELRNGAASAAGSAAAIGRATPADFVFQAVDESGASGGANVRRAQWVRYCLDTAVPENGQIWRQTWGWTGAAVPAVPFGTGCPDTSAGTRQVVSDRLVNTLAAPPTALFAYEPPLPANPAKEDYTQITHVRLDLLVNSDPARQTRASRITSGVYLRNQADPPTARFEAAVSGNGRAYLNASPSSDPRGTPLTYAWRDGETAIGEGLTLQYVALPGTHEIVLTVTNPSGLSDTAARQVVIP